MSTRLDDLIPFTRMMLGDLARKKYTDDTLMEVLMLTTATLQLLGYDRGHVSTPDSISPDLSEKEKALWGKCAAVLIQDPEAQTAAANAISIRTLGTSYSTVASAGLLDSQASAAFTELRLMIRALAATPLVGTRDNLDFDTLP